MIVSVRWWRTQLRISLLSLPNEQYCTPAQHVSRGLRQVAVRTM